MKYWGFPLYIVFCLITLATDWPVRVMPKPEAGFVWGLCWISPLFAAALWWFFSLIDNRQ